MTLLEGGTSPEKLVLTESVIAPPGRRGGLSVIFAVLCIVDLFGVFPVITLPRSIISCGVYGIPLVLSVIGLQLYTAVLLGRSWLLAQEISPGIIDKNRYPYAAIAELAFGAHMKRLVSILINATVFGSGIPNFLLASQSLQMFWWKMSGGEVGISYCFWMLLLAVLLCPIMWLGSPKDMKPLAVASVVIVSTVAISTWVCIATDNVSPPSEGTVLDYQPEVHDFLIAYGILAFQFDIHPMLLTIQVDMRDSRHINRAMLGAFGFTGALFTVTTAMAVRRYGMAVDSNILKGVPPSIPLYLVTLLVTLQLCLSSAVGNSALFQNLEDLFRIPRNFCIQRCLVRSSIVALAVFLAESVPRFDLVMGLVGSTLTGPLMFIFPPLFFLKLCYIKSKMPDTPSKMPLRGKRANGYQNLTNIQHGGELSKLPLIWKNVFYTKYKTFTSKYNEIGDFEQDYTVEWYDVTIALIVMFMGIAATVVAAYSSWANSIRYATFSPPCLINSTIAARSFLQMPLTNL